MSRLVVNLCQMAIHRDFPTCGVVACMIEGHTCWLGVLVSFVQGSVAGVESSVLWIEFDTKFMCSLTVQVEIAPY